ncbi:MAG: alpha/beta fold hydrolase [Patescibacteria group bacterium]
MKKKTQILFIHGGMTFKSRKDYIQYLKTRDISLVKKKRWHGDYMDQKLGKRCEIIRPMMPIAENAKYEDWKIYFERYIPHLRHGVILIGGSLGGIFLAKYLSEHTFPKRIRSIYLVCPPFDNSLPGEDLVGGFILQKNLSRLEKSARRLTLLFSKNDDVVPPAHAEKYARKLKHANIIIYKHIKGHFQIEKFPEIVRMINDDL